MRRQLDIVSLPAAAGLIVIETGGTQNATIRGRKKIAMIHPIEFGMVSPLMIIERTSNALTFRPCCSWVRAPYSIDRLKSFKRPLPRVRTILRPFFTIPWSTYTLNLKSPVTFPSQFCRLESTCLFTTLVMLYTQLLSCLLEHVLGMHLLLSSMKAEC